MNILKQLKDRLTFQESDSSKEMVQKQKIIFGFLIVGAFGVVLVLSSGLERVSEEVKPAEKPKKVVLGDLVDPKEVWAARMEEESRKIREVAEGIKKQSALQEKRVELLEKALEAKAKDFENQKIGPSLTSGHTVQSGGLNASSLGNVSQSVLEPQNLFEDYKKTPSPVLREKKIMHLTSSSKNASHYSDTYVLPGGRARAVLTSAIVVSTAIATQSNPDPITLRLAGNMKMPKGWSANLKGAEIIGSCHGNLSSERAICRLHKISWVDEDGRKVSQKIKGWVFGEDAGMGIRGKVVDKAGAVAREAFISGILSGMSNFLKFEAQSSAFPTNILGQKNALDPKEALKGGLGQGASNAFEKLAEFSIKRAEAMQPVIVVHPGRVVDIVVGEEFDLSEEKVPLKRVRGSQRES